MKEVSAMSPEGKRALITGVRRMVFAGLILLGAWLLLIGLRGSAASITAELIAGQSGLPQETVIESLAESGWSSSWVTGEPIAEMMAGRLGPTAQLVVLGGLMGLVIAAVLLFLGFLISQVTDRPSWLAQVRGVLRLVLVSRGVTIPIFAGATLLIIYPAIWWGYMPPIMFIPFFDDPIGNLEMMILPAFFISLLPAWLLVQAGHGELANWLGKPTSSYGLLARDVSVKLVTRLLKLVGAIFVVALLMEQIFVLPGLGRLMMNAAMQRDYPVAFGVVWVFVLIVVLVKLAAELIEVAYNHFAKPPVSPEHAEEQTAPRVTIPKGWLFFSLGLVFLSIVAAVVGPMFAPYGMNEIHAGDMLAAPSAKYMLGTDNLGRDIFSRLLFGLRTDFLALMCIPGLVIIATGWAILAAYLRRANNWLGDTLEDLVMLPRDVACAFPWLLLLILLMSIMGPGLFTVALIGGLLLLPRAVGMMREAYSSPPEGRGWLYSVLWSIPVMILLTVAGSILYTSSASFLGFGIPPPSPELGGMLSGAGRSYMFMAPWMALWPGIPLALLGFVWVMAGDTLLERLGFRTKAVWLKAVE
ncbi:hypothetical protein ES703_64249 [subsurface metagenome]